MTNCRMCKFGKLAYQSDLGIEERKTDSPIYPQWEIILCRRYPAQSISSGGGGGEIHEHGYGTGKYYGVSIQSSFSFPIMNPEEWCGEWQSKS